MMTEWMHQPMLASKHGAAIDTMNGVIHILMAVLFVGWGAFFLYTLFRFRKSAHPVADHHGVTSHTSTYLEIGVAVAEAVLLFGFSVPLWIKWVDKPPAPGEALTVQVTGEQFAWNIHYPGPDGKFGKQSTDKIDMQTNPLGLDRSDPDAKDDVVTLNQLHLPVNRPVIVRLRSKDVIHSFNIPEFRVKQDAVPGLTIPIWFTPTITTEEMRQKTGNPEFTYEIACAQLCGLGHYRMRGFVTVESQDEFTKWFDEEEKKAAEEGSDAWN